jgi:hypothetical protein
VCRATMHSDWDDAATIRAYPGRAGQWNGYVHISKRADQRDRFGNPRASSAGISLTRRGRRHGEARGGTASWRRQVCTPRECDVIAQVSGGPHCRSESGRPRGGARAAREGTFAFVSLGPHALDGLGVARRPKRSGWSMSLLIVSHCILSRHGAPQ